MNQKVLVGTNKNKTFQYTSLRKLIQDRQKCRQGQLQLQDIEFTTSKMYVERDVQDMTDFNVNNYGWLALKKKRCRSRIEEINRNKLNKVVRNIFKPKTKKALQMKKKNPIQNQSISLTLGYSTQPVMDKVRVLNNQEKLSQDMKQTQNLFKYRTFLSKKSSRAILRPLTPIDKLKEFLNQSFQSLTK